MSEKIKILLIEDNWVNHKLYRGMLDSDEYSVTVSEDGQAGIDEFKQNPFDLVITDIIMPKKDGFETIVELKKMDPLARILAISGGRGKNGMDFLEDAKIIGASSTLIKPFTKHEFLEAIDESLFIREKITETDKFEPTRLEAKSLMRDFMEGVEVPTKSTQKSASGQILIIEPNDIARSLYQKYLKSNSKTFKMNLVFSESFSDARDKIGETFYDMVFMEWVDCQGCDPLKFIRNFDNIYGRYDIPIFVVSANNAKIDIQNAFAAGATDYILKPILRNVFLKKVLDKMEN